MPNSSNTSSAFSPCADDGSIDPFHEDVFPLRETPKRMKGRRVHPSTVWRWVQRGVRGHKLETIRIGGITCTSEKALARFFAALSNANSSKAKPINDAARQAAVERELARFGL